MQQLREVPDYQSAMALLRRSKGANNYAALAGVEADFETAYFTDDGFGSRWRSDDGIWLLGLGRYEPRLFSALIVGDGQIRATAPRAWMEVGFTERSEWNFYLIETRPKPDSHGYDVVVLDSDQEIAEFLDMHSPHASTKPGDDEILFWHGIRGERGEILSLGAAVRWRGGAKMLVSIATNPKMRGQGMAQAVTSSLTTMLFEQGAPCVGLGVWAANKPARRAYERTGFQLTEEFVSGPLTLT